MKGSYFYQFYGGENGNNGDEHADAASMDETGVWKKKGEMSAKKHP